jgi:hypothetical protein
MVNRQREWRRRCDGVSRRDLLQVGALSALGITAGTLPGQLAEAGSSGGRAKRCILLWLDGGPSHLETLDPKPDAPQEVRGPFEVIQTPIPGILLSELLPRTAGLIQKLAIIRSMTSPLGEHNFGTHYMMTGYKPTSVLEYPVVGSVLGHMKSSPDAILPAHTAVPDFRVGGAKLTGNGYLPASVAPFSVLGDPAKKGFKVRDLDFFTHVTADRMQRRRRYLAQLDQFRRELESGDEGQHDPQFEQAYRLVMSSSAREAFALEQEPEQVRRRYGSKTMGQSCLLARRLVERGVPFVTVNQRGWDTHNDLYTRLKEGYSGARVPVGLIPTLDTAFSALVEDLQQRGLLDETLVMVMGEFGRTPKLNTLGGRDHWPRVFSVMMCGGGIRGGTVVGASDSVGESPANRPVTPSDLACTVFHLLGIDPAGLLQTADGRPVRITADGSRPISEVLQA